jgi:hypothetical protein
MRLLRGEPLDSHTRELWVVVHRLAAWRDDYLGLGVGGETRRMHRQSSGKAVIQGYGVACSALGVRRPHASSVAVQTLVDRSAFAFKSLGCLRTSVQTLSY